ncbi:MAG: hypothetical protein H7267_11620, partial [Sandarakinorhabdus sp.]|nr:hypothetical protein [Sandarakinorhabdus sp.]
MTNTVHPVPADAAAHTLTTMTQYRARYAQSIADPDGYWREQLPRLGWLKTPTVMGNWSWDPV